MGVEVQTLDAPVVAANGLTVNVIAAVQPVTLTTNDIVAVPADTPVTTAFTEPTEAIDGSLLLQIPLPTCVSEVVNPSHTLGTPVIADSRLTVMP
jgi:hypothetical protein